MVVHRGEFYTFKIFHDNETRKNEIHNFQNRLKFDPEISARKKVSYGGHVKNVLLFKSVATGLPPQIMNTALNSTLAKEGPKCFLVDIRRLFCL